MNLIINDDIYNSARSLYSDKLHYHNFSHISDVLDNAEKILEQCDIQNITYNKKVVFHAVLFHDAGYIKNHIEKGYKDKESYSAFLAETILSDSGESKEYIQEVSQAILCTRMNSECHSNNDMIVRAADLYGLAAPYSQFKSKAIDLYKERELMSGQKISWEEYKVEACNIIRKFIKPRIQLNIELFAQDNSMFQEKVLQNLDKLMKDTID